MSTILNAYNLNGGDTTSSVFTYAGSTRNLDIEILTSLVSGYSAYVIIETSSDESNWILVPNSQIQINRGSDSYVYHITESEGAYVRAKLFRMDSHSGVMTINASEPSGGGGGTQTLAQTLLLGNTTGGEDISISNGDKIVLDNGSELRAGSYDFGGTGGISRICSVGYEDMWQSGIHHIFDNNGFIRESNNCFSINPDNTFDNTLRFKVGSRWVLDDGTTYMCTDASTGASVWIPINGIITLTYTEATALINNIIIGQKYLITDATANSIPLSVIGTSTTTYSVNADDAAFPTDVVEYDFANDLITWRWDTVNDVSSYEDWRNGTPACIIGSGCSFVLIGKNTTGAIPDNTSRFNCGNNCVVDLTGTGTVLIRTTMEQYSSITDGGFDCTISRCVFQTSSIVTLSSATSLSNINLGISASLIGSDFEPSFDSGNIGANSGLTIGGGGTNTNFTISNSCTITANSINNYSCANGLDIATTGDLSDYISLTTQTATIAATDIPGTEGAGIYEFFFYLVNTTIDAGAGSVTFSISWVDLSGNTRTVSSIALPLTAGGFTNHITGTTAGNLIQTDVSAAIKYSTTVVTAGTSDYALDVVVTKIK